MTDLWSSRTALGELVLRLTSAKVNQLLKVGESLLAPLSAIRNLERGLVVEAFAEEFEARLLIHHGTHTKQLDRIGFEDAFRAASQAAGRSVGTRLGATQRFIDDVISGERVALKTTAARDVTSNWVHISKLSEAAWIQDVRGAQARSEATKRQFSDFLANVDRLYQLRILPSSQDWKYQLVEVPMGLFNPILSLDKNEFVADGPRILVTDARGACLTLVLDRSDAKITVAKIPISRCIVHGEWALPKKVGDA